MPLYHREIHLPVHDYLGRRLYFITICTHNRQPAFADLIAGRWAIAHLQVSAARNAFSLHAFCVMPDHVHFLAEGTTDHSHLIKFADAFKQRTGFQYRKLHVANLWQKRFHVYILRLGDAIEDVAAYIWMNPVRKSLCASPQEYPLSGSQTIAWLQHAGARTQWIPPWRGVAPG